MKKSLKVYCGMVMRPDYGQVHAVIAASSQKTAAKLARESLYAFRQYWCETGNREDRAAALKHPLKLLWATTGNYTHDYTVADGIYNKEKP